MLRSRHPRPLHSLSILLCTLFFSACGVRRAETPALPVLGEVREFTIPWENAFPNDIAVDTAGRVWFTDRLNHAVGMLDPVTGAITRFATPSARSAPYSIVAAPDGGLWFAESVANRLGRIDPATGVIREVELGGAYKGPNILAAGPGAIWFTLRDDNAVGRMDLRTEEVTIGKVEGRPYGITVAADGRVWYGVAQGTALYTIDGALTATRRALQFDGQLLPWRGNSDAPDSVRQRVQAMETARGGDMRRLQADRAGTIWYADYARGLVSYNPATATAKLHRLLEGGSRTYGVAVMRSGLVWYSANVQSEIHVLNPATGERARAALPTRGGTVRHLFVDERRRQVWMPVSDRGIIAVIDFQQ